MTCNTLYELEVTDMRSLSSTTVMLSPNLQLVREFASKSVKDYEHQCSIFHINTLQYNKEKEQYETVRVREFRSE